MSCPHGNPIGGCDTCNEVDAAFEAGKRSALAEQPAQTDWEAVAADQAMTIALMKAEHPAQGCDHCNHALYAGTKCKNCGRMTEQAAIKQDLTPEQPAQQEQEPVAWRPDVCPITGLPFFMWIEHHETGQNVPTYGGPYDSYTIPVRDKDGSYCRERYDHDLGGWWTDEVEDVGIQIVSDQAYVSDDEPPQRTWVGLTDVEWMNIVNKDQAWFGQRPDEVAHEVAKLVEAKLKEKNT